MGHILVGANKWESKLEHIHIPSHTINFSTRALQECANQNCRKCTEKMMGCKNVKINIGVRARCEAPHKFFRHLLQKFLIFILSSARRIKLYPNPAPMYYSVLWKLLTWSHFAKWGINFLFLCYFYLCLCLPNKLEKMPPNISKLIYKNIIFWRFFVVLITKKILPDS
jgi:hypothetical protein